MFENPANVILDNSQATVCEVCGQSVMSQDYDRHLRTHKEKRVETCNICFKSFTSELFETEPKRQELKFQTFFLDISNFKYHIAHHGTERPWLCNECPKNYKTKIDLIQHQRVHDKARDPFQCNVCEAYFLTRSNLNTHMRTHSVKGPQKCEICDKVFVNLRSHIQMVHQKVRRHACNFCDKAFGKKSGLDRHVITVHEKKRCWSCDLCDKSFGEKAQLMRHRKIHFKSTAQTVRSEPTEPPGEDEVVEGESRNNKQRMKCGICKRIVNSRAALKRHKLLIHEGQKNLLCDFCPRMFGERSNLKRHIEKTHHSEADLGVMDAEGDVKMEMKTMLYSCQSCDKMLTTKWGLDAHEAACRLNQQRKLNNRYDSDENEDEVYGDQDLPEERLDSDEELNDMGDVEQIFLSSAADNVDIKQEPDEGDYLEESREEAEAMSELIEVTIKEEPYEEMVLEEQLEVLKPLSRSKFSTILKTEEVVEEIIEEVSVIMQDVPETEKNRRMKSADVPETVKSRRMKSEDFLDPKSLPAYKCKLCSKTFKQLRYVIPHYKSVHDIRRVQCKVVGCEETFIHRTQRMRHQQKVHPETYEESDGGNSDVDYDPIIEEYLEDDDGHSTIEPDVVYECIVCADEFETQDQLDVHFETMHDEGDVENEQVCTTCDPPRTLKNSRALYRHTREVHSGLVFMCPECDRQFTFKRSLERHIRGVHQDIRDFSCGIEGCAEKFRCSYDLKQHQINTHDMGDKADRTCTICQSVFKKVRYLETHMLAKHTTVSFQCGLCDRSFSFERSLRRHIRGVHEDIKDHDCLACPMKFRTAHDLKQHMINEHNVGDKSDRTCTVCQPNKVFKKEKYLQMHMSSIHNDAPLFECPICNRGFSFQRSMERHVRGVHENRRDFKCEAEGCNKCFRSRYELNEHVNNIHTDESEKKRSSLDKLTCDVCDKVCKTPKVLYCHKKIVHEGKKWGTGKVRCKVCLEQFDSKYWKNKHWAQVHRNGEVIHRVCRLCDSEFQFFEDFKDHIDSHTGHFICLICGQDFLDEMSLVTHGETHRRYEDEFRPFICDVCSHRLTTKAQLAIHMRKHFGGHHYICDVSEGWEI